MRKPAERGLGDERGQPSERISSTISARSLLHGVDIHRADLTRLPCRPARRRGSRWRGSSACSGAPEESARMSIRRFGSISRSSQATRLRPMLASQTSSGRLMASGQRRRRSVRHARRAGTSGRARAWRAPRRPPRRRRSRTACPSWPARFASDWATNAAPSKLPLLVRFFVHLRTGSTSRRRVSFDVARVLARRPGSIAFASVRMLITISERWARSLGAAATAKPEARALSALYPTIIRARARRAVRDRRPIRPGASLRVRFSSVKTTPVSIATVRRYPSLTGCALTFLHAIHRAALGLEDHRTGGTPTSFDGRRFERALA